MTKFVSKEIKLEHIRISKHHWGREITDEDIEDLATNIANCGQINRITVRPLGTAGRMYELLAGQRRYKALKAIGAKTARCEVAKCDDKTARIISISENLKVKKPTSREWQKGVKELKDLLHVEVDKKTKQNQRKKELKGKDVDFCPPGGEKSGGKKPRGRPKSGKQEAIQEVAKITGSSKKSVQKAIKREENLTSSALRSLERGLITTHQADMLASMPAKKQKTELVIMIRETQAATAKRRSEERLASNEGDTETAERMLTVVLQYAGDLQVQAGNLIEFLDGKELDYDVLTKKGQRTLHDTRATLDELIQFLEED